MPEFHDILLFLILSFIGGTAITLCFVYGIYSEKEKPILARPHSGPENIVIHPVIETELKFRNVKR